MTLACVGQAAAGAVVRGSVQARSRRPWRGARHACGGAVRRARRARGAGRPRAVQQRVLQPHVQVARPMRVQKSRPTSSCWNRGRARSSLRPFLRARRGPPSQTRSRERRCCEGMDARRAAPLAGAFSTAVP